MKKNLIITAKENITKEKKFGLLVLLLFELALVIVFGIYSLVQFTDSGMAVVGTGNVTVRTLLEVGNTYPEILNITINSGSNINLVPNSTVAVSVVATLRDFNGDGDLRNLTGEFFDNTLSAYGNADDNNLHYSNASCTIDRSITDPYVANATCTFYVQYYANPGVWNVTLFANDNSSYTDLNSSVSTINNLLALALPDSIDYGVVNSTRVSDQIKANVTNMGNTGMNLSLSGYGHIEGDGLAMNCSVGVRNISIGWEKYNLTSSHLGLPMSLNSFIANYTNLTTNSVIRILNLNYRQEDSSTNLDDTNTTYWRIYVPAGAAGTCSGNIIFGAVRSTGI